MIRWLHISDLHLGNEDMSSSLMRKKLIKFIRKDGGHIDYVFLTGDILTANKSGVFTPEMTDYIKEVCQACDITTDRLFIVAGNHDVDRDAAGRDETIQRSLLAWNAYNPREGVISDEDLKIISSGQESFRQFLSGLYTEERLQLYQNPYSPHFVVEADDFNIVHVDTTVSYTKGHEAHDLIIGTSSLLKSLSNLNPKKPSILLTHYPLTSLLQDEKKMVEILLQEHGVRLWLAGHEHDHNLQRLTYMDMLQAGELRYENGATSSFIIGEYDPDTFKAKARAYSWFDQGWAQYPFVDLDAVKKDVFEFVLQPHDKDCVPLLTKKAIAANEIVMHRLTSKLDKRIFPTIITEFEETDISSLLLKSWDERSNVILLGEGGMGKSTMLLSFCKEATTPILYISAEQMASFDYSIKDYCIDILFDGDESAYKEQLSQRLKTPSLIIIVDGLNEVDADHEGRFIREIQRMSLLKGIQFLMASRVDFTVRYNLYGYHKAKLVGLNDDVLSYFFSETEWHSILESRNLYRLVKNPMLATIYKEVCSIIDEFKDDEYLDWKLPIETSTDLFHNFYLAQIALMMKRDGLSRDIFMVAIVCINQILPAIAYEYETSFSINKLNGDFNLILTRILNDLVVDEDSLLSVRNRYRYWNDLTITFGKVCDLIFNQLHLLHNDESMTSFSHQMYRDYLSAQYIIHQSHNQGVIPLLWNRRILPFPIVRHIHYGSNRYWEGIAKNVKQIAENTENPKLIIANIIVCFPSSSIGGIADFSRLKLSGILLPNLIELDKKVSLKEATIDFVSLGLDNDAPNLYRVLSVSPDKRYIAAVAGRRLQIYDLLDNCEPFNYDIGKTATKMLFHGNRLFINAGSIIIFAFDEGWRYIGEVKAESGSIFNSKFRSLRVDEDSLFICYSNRKLEYSLVDCSLIEKRKEPYDIKTVPGHIIDGLKLVINAKEDINSDNPIAVSKVDNLCASSYPNGRIEITLDGEVVNVLGKRVAVLLDAAISLDGKVIVTLSNEKFSEGRRLQIWDAWRKRKILETFCDPQIKSINISENGNWIFGVAGRRTWIYNRLTHNQFWSDDEFISNQKGKLITFGDEILRKNIDGSLESLNLSTGEAIKKDCIDPNPLIVCRLNNDTLGTVTSDGRTFNFISDRGEGIKTIHRYGEAIIAVQPLNGHPFIAVATSSGMVHMYHTGTGQCLRHLDNNYRDIKYTACHPSKTIFAHTDGRKRLTIEYFFTWMNGGQERGLWKSHSYKSKLESNILDLAFNENEGCLVAILANGKILYLSENWCEYQLSSHIITSFNTDAYDFKGVKCTPEIKEILVQNSCEV